MRIKRGSADEPTSAAEMVTCRAGVVHAQCQRAPLQWQGAVTSHVLDPQPETIGDAEEATQATAD
jgi:hypothetical protein